MVSFVDGIPEGANTGEYDGIDVGETVGGDVLGVKLGAPDKLGLSVGS